LFVVFVDFTEIAGIPVHLFIV